MEINDRHGIERISGMVSGYRVDRKEPKTYLTIRACAAIILEALQTGIEPGIKQYNDATKRDAYKLLMFERMIRRNNDYVLTESGKEHIAKNGFEIYKQIKDKI